MKGRRSSAGAGNNRIAIGQTVKIYIRRKAGLKCSKVASIETQWWTAVMNRVSYFSRGNL